MTTWSAWTNREEPEGEGACPWTNADECATARERGVAGTDAMIPDCPEHGIHPDYAFTCVACGAVGVVVNEPGRCRACHDEAVERCGHGVEVPFCPECERTASALRNE
jgi:hypothetical protein